MSKRRGKALAASKAKRRKANRRGKSSPAVSSSNQVDGFVVDEGLTAQQLRFVDELCANPTRPAVNAARIAYPGQTEQSLYATASENLRKPLIRAAIQRRMAPLLHQNRTSREAVTKAVGEGLHWDPADILNEDGTVKPVSGWPPEARRQLVSLDVNEIKIGQKVIGYTKKLKFSNRQEYVQLGARLHKMLTDRIQHEVGGTLEQLLTKVHQGEV